MAATATALLVLTTFVSASDHGVRPTFLLYPYLSLILPSTLFFLALNTVALSTKLKLGHCLEHGLKLDATRRNTIRLIPHVANIPRSDSVGQRSLSSASYADGSAMTQEACVSFCNARG